MQNNGFRSPSDRLFAISARCWRFLQRRRKAVATASIAGIAVVTAAFVWWFFSGPKYTVAECLTGIQIHHSEEISETQWDGILEEIFDFGGTYIFKDGGPAFSAAVDDNDNARWYLLYRDKCENKHEMAQAFVDAYLQAHPSTKIEIEVLREPIRPTRYNAAYGDAWIDGHKERPVE